jgi:phosphoribosylformylglycinamidine cyclo-ligase
VPPIFGLIERLGRVSQSEMDRTFNNGLGFVLVIAQARAHRVLEELRRRRTGACLIGSVTSGECGLAYVAGNA